MVSEPIKKIIKYALAEDIGTGDITTQVTVSPRKKGKAIAVAKENFVVAGIDVFVETFRFLDETIRVKILIDDGRRAKKEMPLSKFPEIYPISCRPSVLR